jgi:hypothetical protein
MFLARYLSVLGCGVETLVPKVLLKKPEAISRVVEFYRMNGEGISQSMRAYIVHFPSLGINQSG